MSTVSNLIFCILFFFFFQAEDGIRDGTVTGVQTCALPIYGFQSNSDNNQPVVALGTVAVHNGIVVNDAELWRRHPQLKRASEVDTEILVTLLRRFRDEAGDLAAGVQRLFREVEGSVSTGVLFDDQDDLLLATNTGSLFVLTNERRSFLCFASERFILQTLAERAGLAGTLGKVEIRQLPAGRALL